MTATEPSTTTELAPDVTASVEQPAVEGTPSAETGEAPALHTVKVDGQEQQVTLEEALAGYQRLSDYTKSKQKLAAEKERLQQADNLVHALETDPVGTLKVLSDMVGAYTQDNEDSNDEALDPTEREIRDLKQRLDQQDQDKHQSEVHEHFTKELERLHSKFGEFSDEELVNLAVEVGTPNLEVAYIYQRELKEAAALEAQGHQQAADEQRRQAAKDAAFVSGGSKRAAGAVSESQPKTGSVRDALVQGFAKYKATQGLT